MSILFLVRHADAYLPSPTSDPATELGALLSPGMPLMIAVPKESNEDENDGLGCPGSDLASLTSSTGIEATEDLLKLRKLCAEPGLALGILGCSSSAESIAPKLSLWACRV